MKYPFFFFLSIGLWMISCTEKSSYRSWSIYGGSKASEHYSSLSQIDTSNVGQLEEAWVYHSGDADTAAHSQIQGNPIMVHNTLFITSSKLRLIALDAGTGKGKWVFNPNPNDQNTLKNQFNLNNNRGVTYWEEGDDRRILFCAGSFIYEVNADNGNPIQDFGENGRVDLHEGLGREVHDLYIAATSPGIIYKNIYIIGSRVNETADAAPGHIRAYDVKTGKMEWVFHTIPHPGEPNYETYPDKEAWKHLGAANAWSGFSLDEKNGILFAPTGAIAFDFYGGKRKGQDLYGNSLLALDAATGKLNWYYQVVHHDVWDKDLPQAPVLVQITKNGKPVEAVAQATKHGFIFVLDRFTGKPIYEVKEIPVDTVSELIGEKLWPTQPIPVLPEPFVRQHISEEDINPYLSPESKNEVLHRMQGLRYGNMFIPPGKKPSLVFPGFDGGAEWGGSAYDPTTGTMYINANEMAWVLTMIDAKHQEGARENYIQAGIRLYSQNCLNCHGTDRKGAGNYPSLVGIEKKYKEEEILNLLASGRRMMPSFARLSFAEKSAIVSYITQNKKEGVKTFSELQKKDDYLNLPYQMDGYHKFLSREGLPAIAPPWGTLNAINLNTGKLLWKKPLGEDPELKKKGIRFTGTENYGGPVVTAGGLVFIAATKDEKIRAFNKKTGKLLWEHDLPASGFATPATYEMDGKQFLVIACGGGKLGTKSSDAYLAFALK